MKCMENACKHTVHYGSLQTSICRIRKLNALLTYFQQYSLPTIFTICCPTSCSTNPSTFSCRNLMSAGLDKNSMQYTMNHAAVMALVLPQIVSEAISEHLISKNFPGEHFLRPLLLFMFIHGPILQSLQHS